MIALFVAFLVCCSFSFFLGAAFGALTMRVRVAREMQKLDIAPAVARYRSKL